MNCQRPTSWGTRRLNLTVFDPFPYLCKEPPRISFDETRRQGDADAVPHCPRIALTVLSGAGWVEADAPSLFSALPRWGLINALFCLLLLHLKSYISRMLSPAANGKMVKENNTLAATNLSALVGKVANQK